MPRRKQPLIPDELLDQLLAGSDPRSALADGGLLDGLKKALAERALNAELDHHLEAGEPDGRANARNGYGAKTVLTGTGKLDLQVPRDRLATFDPQLIAKYQRRFPGFDDKIVSMYARGMSTREIAGHLRELYGIDVSPDLISAVTDAVLEEIVAVFPEATVQTCIVPLLRQSLAFVAYKDRKAVAAALKEIYRALDATAGEAALAAFEEGPWGPKYPAIGQSWRRAWGEVVPFYAFPGDVRRLVYTTNAIEALNSKLRRAVRTRGHFPTDEAALKLLFLVLNRAEKAWRMPPREWALAKAQFAVLFGERFTRAMAG